jgi:hypothetical protein
MLNTIKYDSGGHGMRNLTRFSRLFLLSFILLSLACLPAMAESTFDQPSLLEYSQPNGAESRLSLKNLPAGMAYTTLDSQPSMLYAMNDSSNASAGDPRKKEQHHPAIGKWHKYLGYGTILMAGVVAVSSSSESFHEAAAYLTAGGAVSTVLTGYLAHSSRFDMDNGLFADDNLHIILGTLGAAILTTAVVIADGGDESSHSGLGIAGGALMTLGIVKIVW